MVDENEVLEIKNSQIVIRSHGVSENLKENLKKILMKLWMQLAQFF